MTTETWVSLMPRFAYEVNKDCVVRSLDGTYMEPLETGSYMLPSAVGSHTTLWTGDDLMELFGLMTNDNTHTGFS